MAYTIITSTEKYQANVIAYTMAIGLSIKKTEAGITTQTVTYIWLGIWNGISIFFTLLFYSEISKVCDTSLNYDVTVYMNSKLSVHFFFDNKMLSVSSYNISLTHLESILETCI